MNSANLKSILTTVIVLCVYGSMVALAFVYDGIYIQIVIDLGIMIVSAIIGYIYKARSSKEQS
jgi:hypothetical protein